MELAEKVQSLLRNENNVWLQVELESLKHTYETKLSLNKPQSRNF